MLLNWSHSLWGAIIMSLCHIPLAHSLQGSGQNDKMSTTNTKSKSKSKLRVCTRHPRVILVHQFGRANGFRLGRVVSEAVSTWKDMLLLSHPNASNIFQARGDRLSSLPVGHRHW
jgi:hypothetical protein